MSTTKGPSHEKMLYSESFLLIRSLGVLHNLHVLNIYSLYFIISVMKLGWGFLLRRLSMYIDHHSVTKISKIALSVTHYIY